MTWRCRRKCLVMAKAESHYSQIARELWELGLTWKVYKPFSVQEETGCMQHTLFLAYISKTNQTKKPHKPNKPTISTREIHNTCKGSAISFKQKKTNQPTKDRCVGKCIKQSSDLKCDSLVKVYWSITIFCSRKKMNTQNFTRMPILSFIK